MNEGVSKWKVIGDDAFMVSPTIIGGGSQKALRQKTSERSQTAYFQSIASSSRTFFGLVSILPHE